MKRMFLKTPLVTYFDFIPKTFFLYFPKFELPNSGCGLSASAVYPPMFTVPRKKAIFVYSK